jgi:hypothetical protein
MLLILMTGLCLSPCPRAQHVIREGHEDGPIRSQTIVIPYVFSSETRGFGVGLGGIHSPKYDPQSTYYGIGYFTDNGSSELILGAYNLKTPFSDRIYYRPFFNAAHMTQKRLYVDGNPDFPDGGAGSNESDPDNYIEENTYEATIDLPIRFTLPIGHFKDQPIHTYITENGILKENPSGATSINPLTSGQSSIIFRPYYRKIFSDVDELETLTFTLGYEHDNRDFAPNPHRGYLWKYTIEHDFDWLQHTRNWTSMEGQINGFVPLPNTSWAHQQTLALSFWSAYAPSYDVGSNDGRPPYFSGPTLGGIWRMKGYPSNRFHDKSAIYYGAEYRIMPEWQPLVGINALRSLDIKWWQFVLLAEVGRVAPSWDLSTLHSDMKWDAGLGFRCMFDKAVARVDLVGSQEQFSIIVMFGHSF